MNPQSVGGLIVDRLLLRDPFLRQGGVVGGDGRAAAGGEVEIDIGAGIVRILDIDDHLARIFGEIHNPDPVARIDDLRQRLRQFFQERFEIFVSLPVIKISETSQPARHRME